MTIANIQGNKAKQTKEIKMKERLNQLLNKLEEIEDAKFIHAFNYAEYKVYGHNPYYRINGEEFFMFQNLEEVRNAYHKVVELLDEIYDTINSIMYPTISRKGQWNEFYFVAIKNGLRMIIEEPKGENIGKQYKEAFQTIYE